MKLRSVITLAFVAIILMVAGVGNALAVTWSGTDQSNMNNGNVWWYSLVSTNPVPVVSGGSWLTWENGFYNVGTNSYWPQLYYKQDSGGMSDVDQYDSALGQYGYWWPDTAQLQAERTSGSHHFDVVHWWGPIQGYYNAYASFDQPYTVS